MDTAKRGNESKFEYIKRLTDNRVQMDLDYSEWAKLTVGYDCSSDNARKGYYLVTKLLNQLEEDKEEQIIEKASIGGEFEELLLELEMKKIELKKERIKISTLRSELNKAVREESRKELFYENIHEAIISNPLKPMTFNSTNNNMGKDREFLLALGDVHFGSTFDIGINKYSPQICKERFNELYTQVNELINKENITHLHIASLGDMIQGVLRLSDLKLNSISMIEQIMGVARIIGNFLNQLSQYCRITYYHTINANHSELRLLSSKSGELAEDVELLIGNYIEDLLVMNDNVKVVIGKDGITDVQLCGYNVALTHGQNVKNKEAYIKDLSITQHKHYDFLIMAHIHHYSCATVSTTQDGNPTQVISIPSIIGSCPYSQKIMKTSPSGCLLFCFEEGKGKSNTYEINLK